MKCKVDLWSINTEHKDRRNNANFFSRHANGCTSSPLFEEIILLEMQCHDDDVVLVHDDDEDNDSGGGGDDCGDLCHSETKK